MAQNDNQEFRVKIVRCLGFLAFSLKIAAEKKETAFTAKKEVFIPNLRPPCFVIRLTKLFIYYIMFYI